MKSIKLHLIVLVIIVIFKLERDTIMAALRTVPFRRGGRERRKEYG